MKVQWEVSDGYVGNGKHITHIDDEEFAAELEGCDTKQQRDIIIEDYVQSDFNQKISFSVIGEVK